MIRPFTLVGVLAVAGAGLYNYQVKHAVSLLDRQLRDVHRQIEAARERTQVLRAEWALLNEPERLRAVAQRHLSLEPMMPAQFVRQSELARRLPAPVAFAGAPSLFAPPPTPEPTPAPAEVMASAAPPAPPVARAEPRAPDPVRAEPRPAEVRPVAAARPASPPAPPAAIRPALHVEPQPPARVAPPVPRPAVASSLGTSLPSLPPPVPIAPASAGTLPGAGPPGR